MFCPNCGKQSSGKWCKNCGTQLEAEQKFELNPYDSARPNTQAASGGFSVPDDMALGETRKIEKSDITGQEAVRTAPDVSETVRYTASASEEISAPAGSAGGMPSARGSVMPGSPMASEPTKPIGPGTRSGMSAPASAGEPFGTPAPEAPSMTPPAAKAPERKAPAAPIYISRKSSVYSDDDIDDDARYNISDDFDPYGDYKEDKEASKRRGMIIAISVCATLIIAAVVVIIILTYTGGDKKNTANQESKPTAAEQTKSESDKLYSKGMDYIEAHDYDEAERIFKSLMESSSEEEYKELYKILFNYNKARDAVDKKDYSKARKSFDDGLDSYVSDIDSFTKDIEELEQEIKDGETAYEIFESIKDHMESGDFDLANEEIATLEEKHLKDADKEKLDDFKKQIKEEQNTEEENLSDEKANDIIKNFFESFIDAVNGDDFDLVKGSLHEKSSAYNAIKKNVELYAKNGYKMKFTDVKVDKPERQNSNIWTAKVREIYDVTVEEDDVTHKEEEYVYTIEYIDNEYYITDRE